MNKINRLILIALASLILNGCASTLHFLFDVDDNLYYNNQEKKWEVKNEARQLQGHPVQR